MIKQILKDKDVFIIVGNQGTGKTTLKNEIKKTLGGSFIEYEDYHFTTFKLSEAERHRQINKILTDITSLRHTNKKIIIVCYRFPNEFNNHLNRSYIQSKVSYLFTSIDAHSIFECPLNFDGKKVKLFQRKHYNAIIRKQKTRPCLIVNKLESEIVRFKHAV